MPARRAGDRALALGEQQVPEARKNSLVLLPPGRVQHLRVRDGAPARNRARAQVRLAPQPVPSSGLWVERGAGRRHADRVRRAGHGVEAGGLMTKGPPLAFQLIQLSDREPCLNANLP